MIQHGDTGFSQINSSSTQQVDIGSRIRSYRKMRKLTLRQVAHRSGITDSFLSQLERGVSNGSIGTLHNVAAALGLTVADLFNDEHLVGLQVLRAQERKPLKAGAVTKYLLTQHPLQQIEVLEAILEPGAETGHSEYTHGDSQELLYVIEGQLQLHLGNDSFDLMASDSIEYRSSVPHAAKNSGLVIARALWIISPPSF